MKIESNDNVRLHRRAFLAASAGVAGSLSLAGLGLSARDALAAATPKTFKLVAAPGRWPVVGAPYADTPVWSYGEVPGPEIRLRQGERLRVVVENRLAEDTTVHWHGIRLPNAMDGVPDLTQKPIAPGETFTYEFDCPDAGTFWYHPHQRSSAQVGRGLYGALIVEETQPVPVDRDVTWVLSDWRLLKDATISDDFGNMHDVAHNGRVGNTVTVNGRVRDTFAVRAGERIRLRLINAANARIFGLAFEGHDVTVIALDGQPVEPHAPPNGRVVLGPAMRVDVLLDLTGKPGTRYRVSDTFYRRMEYRLLDLAYGDEAPLRDAPDKTLVKLPPNPLSEPDMQNAERHEVTLGGGMMGMMMSATMNGRPADMRTLMQNGMAWAINGRAESEHVHEPLFTLQRNRSYVLTLINDTAWHHPMHLHGHSFRVISRNGEPTVHREWQDTVLLNPRERAEIAFVADNPGDWMFHCHILEHQAGGMMSLVRVT
jgi:FtsP/CotA-like multicopper oxidase with cupredoxin domain